MVLTVRLATVLMLWRMSAIKATGIGHDLGGLQLGLLLEDHRKWLLFVIRTNS